MLNVTHLISKRLIGLSVAICFVISVLLLPSPTTKAKAHSQDREPYKHTGVEGTLSGKILFEGEAPIKKRIDMSADANCAEIARNPRTEDFIMTNGQLANAFVYVKGAELDRFVFEVPSAAVVIDQQQCQFTPRVVGVQTGQTLTFLNSDPTTHNVHPAPRVNFEWNKMHTAYGTPIETRFTRAETLIPIKCNQHPWMKAYVGVLSHPFFAVSSKDGAFSIAGLPPGDYTLVAWHETRGEQTASFSIRSGEAKSVDFVFGTKTSGVPSRNLEIGAWLNLR
jgi:plastocyanin